MKFRPVAIRPGCVLLFAALLFSRSLSVNAADPAPRSASDQDGKVLEALLLKLADDPDANLATRDATGRTNIILVPLGPDKFGIAQKHQVEADTDKKIPAEEFKDFETRNRVPGSYDTYQASFKDLKLSPPIQILDPGDDLRSFQFIKKFPTARAWVQAYFPGYSKDGQTAFFRLRLGPTPHGATVTALLKKDGARWKVVWHKLAFYV